MNENQTSGQSDSGSDSKSSTFTIRAELSFEDDTLAQDENGSQRVAKYGRGFGQGIEVRLEGTDDQGYPVSADVTAAISAIVKIIRFLNLSKPMKELKKVTITQVQQPKGS